jgi:glycosyltransferase involved in cell wall biosynthesis
LGISPDEYLLLQPTRIVPRKRIELAIELTRLLGKRCTLVISHSSGDEGSSYETHLRELARLLDVRVIFGADRFNHRRGTNAAGQKIYSLADIYHHADMVTYPSNVEGFGNAFLESIYYRRPIVISTYEIFRIDIQPKGFDVIGFGDFIDAQTVHQVEQWLQNPSLVQEAVERNYKLGRRFYSYHNLEFHLTALLKATLGMNDSQIPAMPPPRQTKEP